MPAPKFNPKPPIPITLEEIQELKVALEKMLPVPLGLEGTSFYPTYGPWTNSRELASYVMDLTDQEDIKDAYYVLTQWQETFSQAPQYEAPTTSNVPEAGIREAQEAERARREEAEAAAKEKGTAQTEEFIESQLKRMKRIKVTPKEEIPVVILDDKEKETLHHLGVAAKTDPGTTQKIIEEKIKEALSKSSPEVREAVPQLVITKTAVDFVNKVKPFGEYKTAKEIPNKISVMHPASPIAAIALVNDAKLKGLIPDDQARKILSRNAQSIALAIETERNVNATLTKSFLYETPNIITALYGPEQVTQFKISDDQSEKNQDSIDIDIQEIVDRGKDVRNIWKKIATRETAVVETGEITTTISSYTPSIDTAVVSQTSSLLTKVLPVAGAVTEFQGSVLASQWIASGTPLLVGTQIAGFIGSGQFQTAALTSLATQGEILYHAGIGKYTFTVAKLSKGPIELYAAGIKFGNKGFGIGAIKVGDKVFSTGTITSAGGKIAGKALPAIFTKISAFLGSVGPVVGTILGAITGWVVGKILEKIPWDKVKKALPYIAGLILLPFFGPIAAIAGGLGTAVLIGIGSGVGAGATLAGIGSGIFGFFGALGSAVLITIGTPILVTLLVFPIVVALILFIINSGAYIVPPSSISSLKGYDNPYMSVTKVASPNKISNGSQTVTYTVTITALKSPLTNIKITSTSCKVTKKNKSQVKCPIENIPNIPSDIVISPASPYSFTFTVNFDSSLADSIVFDSIEISADTPEEAGIITSGSETVCVGDCPTSCIKTVENANPWPGNIRAITENAAISLEGTYPNFIAKVCSSGEVNLCYKPSAVSAGGWHVHGQFGDECDVYFNGKVLSSERNALFMLAHELTHHIQAISGVELEYAQSGGQSELPICSYPYPEAGKTLTEGMAEAIGLYVSIPTWAGCVGNYQNHYPLNYNFAKGFMR